MRDDDRPPVERLRNSEQRRPRSRRTGTPPRSAPVSGDALAIGADRDGLAHAEAEIAKLISGPRNGTYRQDERADRRHAHAVADGRRHLDGLEAEAKRLTWAHVGQRAPTGVDTRHLGQIGVSQRPQRSTVSVFGWRAQRSVPPGDGSVLMRHALTASARAERARARSAAASTTATSTMARHVRAGQPCGRAEAVAAVNARRAGERLADDLVPRVVGGIRPPGAVVARPEDARRRACRRRSRVDHAAVVADDQSAAADQRAERLRARRGGREAAGGAELRRRPARASACSSGSTPLRTSGLSRVALEGIGRRRAKRSGAQRRARLNAPEPGTSSTASSDELAPARGGPARRRRVRWAARGAACCGCAAPRTPTTSSAVVHLVLPAEAVVGGRVGQEPAAAAVVQTDTLRARRCPGSARRTWRCRTAWSGGAAGPACPSRRRAACAASASASAGCARRRVAGRRRTCRRGGPRRSCPGRAARARCRGW